MTRKTRKTAVIMVVNGGYGRELVSAAEVIVGGLQVEVVETPCMVGIDELRSRVRSSIEQFSREKRDVLFLADLCGSTPANICLEFLARSPRWEMLTGVNLAMLLKLATCEVDLGARELARRLRTTGEESIKLGSTFLPEKVPDGH